jgi:FKBP-type peptidyl-prolyl cis-trans isomerase
MPQGANAAIADGSRPEASRLFGVAPLRRHPNLETQVHILLSTLLACGETAPTDEAHDAVATDEAKPADEHATPTPPPAPEPAAAPAEIAAPPDVAAPPADAQKTASGLAYKVLQKGTGTEHPTATSTVTVHYSGWTTDGKMFDSSVQRGQPAQFPLNRVIPGWTEGLQLMVVGEKTRFWIPVEQAYKNVPGRPAGMLVFDVELLEIGSGAM